MIWDPSRYLPDRAEDKKAPNAFVGWGTGRHPCLGMRFAKLESNIITVFFCSMFDFELLNENFELMDTQPPININNWQASPPDKKVYIKYKLRE
jgi:cytochrome P450